MSNIMDVLSSLLTGQAQPAPAVGPMAQGAPVPSAQQQPGIPVPLPKPMPQPLSTQPVQEPNLAGFDTSRIGDIFSGAAGVQPGSSAVQAFSQGFSGSSASREARAKQARDRAAAETAAADKARQQSFDNQLKMDQNRRAESAARFSNLKSAADIQKLASEAKKYGVTPKALADLEKRMNDYREILAGKYGQLMVEDGDPDTVRNAIEVLVDQERERQIAMLRDAGGAPAADQPMGSEANPYVPATVADLQSVPTGGIFRNPADGKLYRKK